MAKVFSYVRCSSREQLKDDSIRRQIEKRDDWLKKNGKTLDTSLNLNDYGMSAFTGEHAATGALAAFNKAIESKYVHLPRYLCESYAI